MKLQFFKKPNVQSVENVDQSKRGRLLQSMGSCLFYGVIFMIVFSSVFSNQNDKDVKSLFGITPMYITSRSMEPLMEPGTLIFSRKTDPSALRVGDDISFLDKTDNGTQRVITHRIVAIETVDDSLEFETKGINNEVADAKKVHADNVIGKVSGVIPYAGIFVSYMSQNIVKVSIFVVVVYILYKMYQWYLVSNKENDQEEGRLDDDAAPEDLQSKARVHE